MSRARRSVSDKDIRQYEQFMAQMKSVLRPLGQVDSVSMHPLVLALLARMVFWQMKRISMSREDKGKGCARLM